MAPVAREMWTPPPASASGRLAPRSNSAARCIASRAGRQRRAGAAMWAGSIVKSPSSNGWVPWHTSSGTSTITGPGRPDVAMAKARRTSSGIRSTASTRSNAFTAGRKMAT